MRRRALRPVTKAGNLDPRRPATPPRYMQRSRAKERAHRSHDALRLADPSHPLSGPTARDRESAGDMETRIFFGKHHYRLSYP